MTEPTDSGTARLDLRHPMTAVRLILTDQRFRFVLVGGINTVLSMGCSLRWTPGWAPAFPASFRW